MLPTTSTGPWAKAHGRFTVISGEGITDLLFDDVVRYLQHGHILPGQSAGPPSTMITSKTSIIYVVLQGGELLHQDDTCLTAVFDHLTWPDTCLDLSNMGFPEEIHT